MKIMKKLAYLSFCAFAGLLLVFVLIICAFVYFISDKEADIKLNSQVSGKIVCYFGTWSTYRPSPWTYTIDNIPGNLCTHLIYTFVGFNETFQLKYLDNQFDIVREGFKKFVALRAKWPRLKFIIAVGGWSVGGALFSNMVKDRESRKAFITSVDTFLTRYKFDGLDLDWQYPGSTEHQGNYKDKENFAKLIKELRTEFDKHNYILSSTVPITSSRIQDGYKIAELARDLDHFHVLTYNLRGVRSPFVDVHSPLFPRSTDGEEVFGLNVRDGLQYWASLGVPKYKLVVGIPFFGKTFTLECEENNGIKAPINKTYHTGRPGESTREAGILAYYEICQGLLLNKWTREWDDETKVPYAYYKDQWVGYEDEESIRFKMEFIRKEGYGGAMIWTLDLDDFRGECGENNILLRTIHKHLRVNTLKFFT
uniref:chitinase n=1 Tax=Tetranychus cinnabarinus TaxID=93129 RepID=A0A1I9UVU7_TETCI|nr:chitinase [Tetranychus cinnabarinus]